MERLPVEIIENIIYQLKIVLREALEREHAPLLWRSKLAPYSTVSRGFQYAVERETFKSLEMASESSVDDLAYVVDNGIGRAAAVRKISYKLYHHYETSAELAMRRHLKTKNDMSFCEGLIKLLNVIDNWHCIDGNVGAIELHLSPLRNRNLHGIKDPLSDQRLLIEHWEQRLASRKYPVYIDVYGCQFPALEYISTFSVTENHNIGPAALMKLLSHMRNLKRFEGYFDDSEREDVEIRQSYRSELGQNLIILPRSLKSFEAKFGCEIDQSMCARDSSLKPQSALFDPKIDDLCLGLFFVSQRLERLVIEQICISPTLFWYEIEHNENTWLDLKEIQIIYEPVTADGRWLIDVDPDAIYSDIDDSDDSDAQSIQRPEIRGIINRSLVNPFFINAAKAVHHMPSLRSMELSLNRWSQSTLEFRFSWSTEKNRYEVLWIANSTFELDDEVIDAWGINREDIEIDDWDKKYPGIRDIMAPIKWKPGGFST